MNFRLNCGESQGNIKNINLCHYYVIIWRLGLEGNTTHMYTENNRDDAFLKASFNQKQRIYNMFVIKGSLKIILWISAFLQISVIHESLIPFRSIRVMGYSYEKI